MRIDLGRGVCGTAVTERRTLVVPDVAAFPGNIAGDPSSRSEVVVPIARDQRVVAVIDVDSRELAAFGAADAALLEEVARLAAGPHWPAPAGER